MARFKLPMWSDFVRAEENSVENLRERLGGRVGAERFRDCGALVMVDSEDEPRLAPGGARKDQFGVVLTRDDTGAFVWTGPRLVRRVPTARLQVPVVGAVPEEFEQMSADARAFGVLQEGDHVAFADQRGGSARGVLLEKCRFGALVRSEAGAVLAVGFQGVSSAASAVH